MFKSIIENKDISAIISSSFTLYFDYKCNKTFTQTLKKVQKNKIKNFFLLSDEKSFKDFNIEVFPTQITFENNKEKTRILLGK